MEKPVTDWSEKVDNVIFDLGGVILNLSYQKTIQAFSELAGVDASELYTQHKQDPIFDALETGQISPSIFRDRLRELFQMEATDHQLDRAWNALLLDIPQERLAFLREVSKKKRIFLLSNTNSIHKEAFDQDILSRFGLQSLDVFFEKAYYSHQMGDRKPNTSIFLKVLNQNDLLPSRTLFIDDSIQHIETARSIGLHTFFMQSPFTILDLKF